MRRPLAILVLVLVAAVFAGGCTTVVPDQVVARAPSWDGNEQNSGVLDLAPGGGAEITAGARERYNALIRIYGRDFVPALHEDDGIAPAGEHYVISREYLEKFIEMAAWRRAGFAPQNK